MEGPDPQFDFPVLRELHARGGTDYVAMPLFFLVITSYSIHYTKLYESDTPSPGDKRDQ